MKFYNSLAGILAEQNLKQADLCRMTGISTALMSNYMTGKSSPSLDNALIIAKALGITLDYLVGHETPAASLSKAKTMLLADYDALDNEGQSLIKSMLSSLKMTHARQRNRAASVQKNIGGINYGMVGGNFSSKVTIRE